MRNKATTDLTDGNMVRPGKAFAETKRAGEQARAGVSDVAGQLRSTVKSSVAGLKDAAKKVSESVGAASASRGSTASEKPSAKASADSDGK
ncbi:hypothetical protein [Mycolicibacterium fortuitum]|uniref:hypothetical protein n=1 Tax=Mycolicibacterium fortuitum TaxID=1766 RepID=UPI0010424B82|nr:hypothetical protein [Mycolicibacterium fortuitum]